MRQSACLFVLPELFREEISNCFVSFNTKSPVAQAGFEILMQPKMTMDFWSSCLHLSSVKITLVCRHSQFMRSRGLNPGLCTLLGKFSTS